MYRLTHPPRSFPIQLPYNRQYKFEPIPEDDPAYRPVTRELNTDNLRWVQQWGDVADREYTIRFTTPANGFELPIGEYERIYKHTRLGENRIDFEIKSVPEEAEIETSTEGGYLYSSKQRINYFANITTEGYTDVNKSHRGAMIGYQIPVLVYESRLMKGVDSEGNPEWYNKVIERHRSEGFGIQTGAEHDTSPTLIKAPAPDNRNDIYIGGFVAESYVYYPEGVLQGSAEEGVVAWSKDELWDFSHIGWSEGGYPKFKE